MWKLTWARLVVLKSCHVPKLIYLNQLVEGLISKFMWREARSFFPRTLRARLYLRRNGERLIVWWGNNSRWLRTQRNFRLQLSFLQIENNDTKSMLGTQLRGILLRSSKDGQFEVTQQFWALNSSREMFFIFSEFILCCLGTFFPKT